MEFSHEDRMALQRAQGGWSCACEVASYRRAAFFGATKLRNDLFEDVAADVSEPADAAGVVIGQVLVVEAQEV